MPEQPSTDHPPVNPDVRYEKTDVKFGPIVAGGVGLLVLGLIVHWVSLWTFEALTASAARKDPGLPPLAAKERPQLPSDINKIPAPRLQVSETVDLEELRRAEDKRLNSYGWMDAKAGTVHIPIGEAMALLADPEIAKARGIRVEPPKDKAVPKGGER